MLRATSVLLCMFSVTSQIYVSSTVCSHPMVKILYAQENQTPEQRRESYKGSIDSLVAHSRDALTKEYSKEETAHFELLKYDLRKYLDARKAHLEAKIKLAIATRNLRASYEELQRIRK